jgi:hypothetical protein
VNANVLFAVALIELALALFAMRWRLQMEFMVVFATALMIGTHPVAPAPLLIAAVAGYAASVVWRVIQVPTRPQQQAKLWLFRHGYDPGIGMSPRAPIVMAAAASAALLVPDAWSLVALLGFVAVTVWDSVEWQRQRGPGSRMGYPLGAMSVAAVANVPGLALLLAVAGGTLTWADPTAAKEVLPQLVATQIALGLLPLTALSFAASFVVSSAGVGAIRALPWKTTGFVLFFVLLSISYDLVQLGSTTRQGDLEWLELVGLVAILTSLVASVYVTYYLRLGRIATALVRRVDMAWLDEVARKYQEPYQPWFGPDPLRDIERFLYFAATRESDIRMFEATLQELVERMRFVAQRRAPKNDPRLEFGLDEHFAHTFQALIDEAAKQRKGWVLESLIWFRGQVTEWVIENGPGAPHAARPHLQRTAYLDPPSGLQLLGRIVEAAIENGLEEEGQRGVARFARYAQERISGLPDPTGVFDIDPDPNAHFQADAPAYQVASAIESVLQTLRRWAERAADQHCEEVGETVALSLSWLVSHAADLPDPRWARWLANEVVSAALMTAIAGLPTRKLWFAVPARHVDFTAQNASHAAVVDAMSFWVPYSIAKCAPVADFGLVMDAATLARELMPGFIDVAAAIGAALEWTRERRRDLPATDDDVFVLRELDRRLARLREAAGARVGEYDQARQAFLERLRKELGAAQPPAGGAVA